MARMNKKELTECDICTKFITPAVERAGWDVVSQIREEVYFTKGRIIVRGKLVTRGKAKFADYILYYKPNIPIARPLIPFMRYSKTSTEVRHLDESSFPGNTHSGFQI